MPPGPVALERRVRVPEHHARVASTPISSSASRSPRLGEEALHVRARRGVAVERAVDRSPTRAACGSSSTSSSPSSSAVRAAIASIGAGASCRSTSQRSALPADPGGVRRAPSAARPSHAARRPRWRSRRRARSPRRRRRRPAPPRARAGCRGCRTAAQATMRTLSRRTFSRSSNRNALIEGTRFRGRTRKTMEKRTARSDRQQPRGACGASRGSADVAEDSPAQQPRDPPRRPGAQHRAAGDAARALASRAAQSVLTISTSQGA